MLQMSSRRLVLLLLLLFSLGIESSLVNLAQRRCRATSGDWCLNYMHQRPLIINRTSSSSLPRGDRPCPVTNSRPCNGVGNCNHDTGLCECPAGWTGKDCSEVLIRPCTNSFGDGKGGAKGHIDSAGRDLNPLAEGYTESRCIGICDSEVARCFCDGAFRPIPAPPGSPPGTPPVKRGRPLGNHMCQPSDDGKGHKLEWGQVPWVDLYGPEGWCEAEKPKFKCPCMYDGFGGELCDEVVEMTCPNQCSGHGECLSGFCKCHEGWYGTDCARLRAGANVGMGPGSEIDRPWIKDWVKQPLEIQQSWIPTAPSSSLLSSTLDATSALSAAASTIVAIRRRPLIYVYDLPPAYNARMLQYKVDRGLCSWRSFGDKNNSWTSPWTYGIEQLLHELMLQSDHRTFDADEADFFYVPLYSSCFIFPIHCWADGPWWYAPSGPRVMHVTNMMVEVRDWMRSRFPWWDRRKGRDHIWLMSHDEGACYAPTEVYEASIMLTHWGRRDPGHVSNTAFTPDNYTQEYVHDLQKGGWLRLIKGHSCYTPGKDLVIPSLKTPPQFASSPLLAATPRNRSMLCFFRGEVGKHRLPHYSRGLRQRLHKLAIDNDWKGKHKIFIGDGSEIPGDYSILLSDSKYALVLPGDGWSARAEDAVLHGCVPVVIMDEVNLIFEPELDWSLFSVRVKEADIGSLPELLASINEAKLKKMQKNLRSVWHRFAYTRHPHLARSVDEILQRNQDGKEMAGRMRKRSYPHADDAFGTIMQWLLSKSERKSSQQLQGQQ